LKTRAGVTLNYKPPRQGGFKQQANIGHKLPIVKPLNPVFEAKEEHSPGSAQA
jgi:hypothetical protein